MRLAAPLVIAVLIAGSLSTASADSELEPMPQNVVAPAATSTVTLLTGDVVTVAAGQAGERTFTVRPARRANGVPVTFSSAADGEHLYVIPSDAAPHLAADKLDLRLFDVAALKSGPPPVIVQYAASRRAMTAGATATLESINAVAFDPKTMDVWSMLTSEGARLANDIRKVWLDATIEADLDVSVPQIGAPSVWDAGVDGTGAKVAVLDTGIDKGHPDLAGKVVAEQNFTDDASTVDGNGHGTHVASIVAGNGGTYKGVAPGADLMVGKVLTNAGSGQLSWAIDGMEWAAANGADVVNLSLSAPPTDGTDPGSLAVDALTRETGTLFVIAAGNDYADAAIGSPGAATEALTVGAVDDQDVLADFSNRGPRRGDAIVKPNLTAPGVGIVAARAAGTSLGSPVDDLYTSASGTSMATPHVAGAAALLAQAHPDWQAEQLKSALVSTTAPGAYTAYQQGAGRVDVGKAFAQRVYGPATADFGRLPDPATEPVTRTLTYTNDTDAPVTLDLGVTGNGWDGRDVPTAAVHLSAPSVTVPAHASATVDLTAEPALLDAGVYSGIVAASAPGGVTVRTPWSLYEASETQQLTVSLKDRRGKPAELGLPIHVVKTNPGFVANDPFRNWYHFAWSDSEGNATFDVAPGVYDVYAQITTWQLDARESTIAVASERSVDAATSIVLDAKQAKRRNPRVSEDVDLLMGEIGVNRQLSDGRSFRMGALFDESTDWELFTSPGARPETGSTESYTKWVLGSQLVRVPGLHPAYWPHAAGPALAGRRTLPVVFADAGENFQPAKGKLALVRIGIPVGEPYPYAYFINELQRVTELAAAAEVAGVLAYADLPGAKAHEVRAEPILQLGLSRDEGEALRKAIERRPTKLTIDGRQSPERVYHVRLGHNGGWPSKGDPTIDKRELTTIPARYHSDSPIQQGEIAWFAFSPNMPDSAQLAVPFWAPAAWTELVANSGPPLRWTRQTFLEDTYLRTWDRIPAGKGERRGTETWGEAPMTYGAVDVAGAYPTTLDCTFCRQGDRFVTGKYRLDASGKHYEYAWFAPPEVRLFRGDTEFPRSGSSWRWFQLPPGAGTYRLTMDYTQPGSAPTALAPKVLTEWVFRSQPPKPGTLPPAYACPFTGDTNACAFEPLIQLRYDLGLSLHNSAPANGTFRFDLHAGPLSGAADRTPVSGTQVQYSTDDGTTWASASVRKKGRGEFGVIVRHPKLEQTNGYVWLRVHAWNGKGDSVDQTVQRAYRLENR